MEWVNSNYDGTMQPLIDSEENWTCEALCDLFRISNRIESVDMTNPTQSGWIWAGIAVYTPLCILGILGNILTIAMFSKFIKKTTTSMFILALAVVDLIVCITLMPISIYTLAKGHSSAVTLCKLEKFVAFLAIPLSGGILLAIALDRFLLILQFNRVIISKFRAKVILVSLTVICTVAAIPQLFAFSTKVDEFNNQQYPDHCEQKVSCNLLVCEPVDSFIAEHVVNLLKRGVIIAFFIISGLLIVFYTLIFVKVYAMHKKMAKYKSSKRKTARQTQLTNDKQTAAVLLASKQVVLGESSSSEGGIMDEMILMKDNGKVSTTPKSRKKRKQFPHLKTAITLFLVTLTFLIAYAPMSIMTLAGTCENKDGNEPVCLRNDYRHFIWRFYFLNHVTNPVIYAFLNPQFRQAVKECYQRLRHKISRKINANS